jgi:hypothetical protein
MATLIAPRPRLVRALTAASALLAGLVLAVCTDRGTDPTGTRAEKKPQLAVGNGFAFGQEPVKIEVFAPENGSRAGFHGVGFLVDMEVDFATTDLAATGFTAPQLTGPGGHADIPPFPGPSAAGKDEHFPGLIVLLSTAQVGAGSCQNLADLFNITGLTNRDEHETELWATWIIAADKFRPSPQETPSTLSVAVAKDLDNDGVFNDAPSVVPDANNDGVCDESDLRAFGIASKVTTVHFSIID